MHRVPIDVVPCSAASLLGDNMAWAIQRLGKGGRVIFLILNGYFLCKVQDLQYGTTLNLVYFAIFVLALRAAGQKVDTMSYYREYYI